MRFYEIYFKVMKLLVTWCSNITAWDAHERIGDLILLPISVVFGVGLSIIFHTAWFAWLAYALVLGVTMGYEVCQNKLETGMAPLKAWAGKRLFDSVGDCWVATYKPFLLAVVMTVILHWSAIAALAR